MVMGEEKPKVEDILRRIDDLIRILKFLSEDLAEISKSLRASLNAAPEAQPSQPIQPPRSAQQTISFEETGPPGVSGGMQTAEDAQRVFPEDLAGMLYFEVTEEYVLVKPRQYLGSDNFRRIAAIVRNQLNGEYVSAGRDSHFRIPREA
jgi:hypothetical protein